MRYVISYDLNEPGQDYERLFAALKDWGAKKVLYSQWCVRRNGTTAAKVSDHFWQYMDSNDRILVIAIDGTGWAGYRLMNKISAM